MIFGLFLCFGFCARFMEMEQNKKGSFFNLAKITDNGFQQLYLCEMRRNILTYGHKKWQVTYIAPLNHLPLLPSGPGGVQQELVV